MAKITTDFVGTETEAVTKARITEILDFWGFDPSAYTTWGNARTDFNAILPDDIGSTEKAGSFLPKINLVNDPLGNSPSILAPILSPSGRKGAFWDFSRDETLWEDTAATDPADLDDPIAAITARAVGNLASATFTQPTIGARPTRKAAFAEFDGGDEINADANVREIFRNVGHGLLAARVRFSTLEQIQGVIAFSVGDSATPRFHMQVMTSGQARIVVRRLTSAESATALDSDGGTIVTGTDYIIMATVDYVNGGASAIRLFVNGSEVATETLAGTGNTEDVVSSAARIGRVNNANTNMTGRVYRAVAIGSDTAFTAGERAIINGILTGA